MRYFNGLLNINTAVALHLWNRHVLPLTKFAVSALTGVLPGRMQIVGACMTGAALILNNVYLRRRARHVQAAR